MPGPRKTIEVGAGHRRSSQPIGEATRGKTAPNRLRRLDLWLLRTERELMGRRGPSPFVDLGYGRLPLTTMESARALRELNPQLPVLGIEVDAERVAVAQRWAGPRTWFVRGGFDVPLSRLPGARAARVVRAMNVLRQYEEPAARDAWRLMGERIEEGGLLIEGTCTPFGRLLVVQLLRKQGEGLADAGLLFSTNFRTPSLRPTDFQAVLPKHLIHRVREGAPIAAMMEAWERSWERARSVEAFGRRAVWVTAAQGLADAGWDVLSDSWLLRRGFMLVRGGFGD